MLDGELLLRRARRPLVIGMGGGGDVVGALATAELARRYDGAAPILGGLAWERRPIDPVPGPRMVAEIEGAQQLAPGVLLAGPHTRVRDREVFFDVGGDVLARGDEPGLRSPLCDAVMLAAAAQLGRLGHEVLVGLFGIGCDAELRPAEVLARLAEVAAADGLAGARGLTV